MSIKLSDPEFAAQLADARSYLMRVARLQLRNDAWAEDAVSQTMVAALEQQSGFEGRSQLRTWLVAILKHKIIDHLRRKGREVLVYDTPEASADEQLEALLFDARGHFREPVRPWPTPQDAMMERQLLAVLEACVERLPANLGRVFLMREWLELDTAEVCKELGVSASNAGVMLHRARLRLRECMRLHWGNEP